MLNCIVCDDDKNIVDAVNDIVKTALCESGCVGNVSAYTDSRILLSDIIEYKPIDLAVIDIEMPHYDGLQIAAEIKKHFPESFIILLTSHLKYAVEAFELQIFRYAQKSDIDVKLPRYVKDALTMLTLQDGCVYTILKNENLERLPYNQILCVKKDGKYSVITCIDRREIRLRKSLNEVINELDEREFLLIDRSCIVNISLISRVCDGEVICKNGMHLSVSRAKLKETKTRVALYWGSKI